PGSYSKCQGSHFEDLAQLGLTQPHVGPCSSSQALAGPRASELHRSIARPHPCTEVPGVAAMKPARRLVANWLDSERYVSVRQMSRPNFSLKRKFSSAKATAASLRSFSPPPMSHSDLDSSLPL